MLRAAIFQNGGLAKVAKTLVGKAQKAEAEKLKFELVQVSP